MAEVENDEVVRVLIADDHAVFRAGLRLLLQTEPGLQVAGEAADGHQAVEQFQALRPDVLLVDLKMPRKGGVEAITEIREHHPDAHILVLTAYGGGQLVLKAVRAGATGYLLKASRPELLLRAVRDVHEGRAVLDPAIAPALMEEMKRPAAVEEPLTGRELDVVRLVSRGLTNREIAERLVISERTVRTHLSRVLDKLNLVNRTQVALYALRRGWATLEE